MVSVHSVITDTVLTYDAEIVLHILVNTVGFPDSRLFPSLQ